MQNLTRRVFFHFKIWYVVFLNSESDMLRFFSIKNMPPKKHEKWKGCGFHGAKRTETWFFERKLFFEILTCRNILNSKSNGLWSFWFKIWLWFVFRFKQKAAKIINYCEEFRDCPCMIIGAACLRIGFFNHVGLMMAVMTNSFALPLQFCKALC